jgi:hypothetical protein
MAKINRCRGENVTFCRFDGPFYLMACLHEDAPIYVRKIPHQRDWHRDVVPRDTEVHESNCLRIAPAFCEVISKRSPTLLGQIGREWETSYSRPCLADHSTGVLIYFQNTPARVQREVGGGRLIEKINMLLKRFFYFQQRFLHRMHLRLGFISFKKQSFQNSREICLVRFFASIPRRPDALYDPHEVILRELFVIHNEIFLQYTFT